jgi:cullin-associated NEDD8-dissociated protein 1
MVINADWHDRFPKTKMQGVGYIGDKFPLCADLPPRPFLANGATFRFLGACSSNGCSYDNGPHMIGKFQPSESSLLYQALCQADGSGACTFPDEVVLDSAIACTGVECDTDYVQGIQIVEGGLTRWYEFIRPPCVRLAFSDSGFWTTYSFYQEKPLFQCADPKAAAAAGLCCNSITGAEVTSPSANKFQQERVTMGTAMDRCAADNTVLCSQFHSYSGFTGAKRESFVWLNKPCALQIQVHPRTGWINIVETPPEPSGDRASKTHPSFGLNGAEYFRIEWEGGTFPEHHDGCGAGCAPAYKESCLCDITVEVIAAFTDPTRVPTVPELEQTLFVGSVAPDTLDNELFEGKAYTKCTSTICEANTEVTVHLKAPPVAVTSTNSGGVGSLPAPIAIASSASGGWVAANTVDGDFASIFHSGWEKTDPWIQIDLGVRRSVTEVDIYHRMTMGRDLFAYHEIWVSDDPVTPREMCYSATGGDTALTWNLPCVATGRYVRILLPGTGRTLMALQFQVQSNGAPSGAPTAAPSAAPTSTDASLLMDEDTIFEFRSAVTGKLVYLRNKMSRVNVGSSFSFRNPPHFLPLLGENYNNNGFDLAAAKRDTEYEVEALLDHLTQHPSAAPFISKLLIQRFITSNPSPRYVKAVASAFTTGTYWHHGNQTVVSGVYGDLGAAMTALLIDREARSTTLDADPAYGQMREPYLKMLHILRAMEYKSYRGSELALTNLGTTGMDAFHAPDVFGFYLPTHKPAGVIDRLGLVSPEAQLATAPNIVSYMNKISSLAKNGLGSNNFGDYARGNARIYQAWREERIPLVTSGNLSWAPPIYAALSNSRKTTCGVPEYGKWCENDESAEIVLGTVGSPAACQALCEARDLTAVPFVGGCCLWNPPALELIATASSKAGSWVADNTVDGDFASIFHSGWEKTDPWIQIDLGVSAAVTEVDIYHRMTMGRDMFAYHEIWVSDDPVTPREMCYNATGGDTALTWNLPCVATGRYVRILLPGTGRTLMALQVVVQASQPGVCSLMPAGVETAEQDALNQWSGTCADADDATARQALVDSAPKVIEDLNLLFADGRFSVHTKGLLESAYVNTVRAWADAPVATAADASSGALRVVKEMAMSVPEFHTTNLNIDAGQRPMPAAQTPLGRKLKAIVVINLHGGADSFNFLVPHSNCGANGTNSLYEDYQNVRGNVALQDTDLLQISVPAGMQPCDTFGLNENFVHSRQLYNDGDSAWIANVGMLVEPITRLEYLSGQRRRPPSLFGHAQQRQQVQQVQADNPNAKGVLGRAIDALMKQDSPYKSQLYTIGGGQKIVTGAPLSPVSVDASRGVQTWIGDGGALQGYYDNITQRRSESIFAETYASQVGASLDSVKELGEALGAAQATTEFPSTSLGDQLKMVSRLIKVGLAQEVERSVFMTGHYGYDTHTSAEDSKGNVLQRLMMEFDDAVGAFATELKQQEVWDDVVIMTVSDFARTLGGNSAAGTDHAWGGNNVVYGGSVNGGRIFGEYPPNLKPGEGQDIGHGRLLPTMGWEGMWSPIFQWFGVNDANMQDVLPNLKNFPPESVIPAADLFTTGS